MPMDEQKQLARKRRERRLRLWLIGLSWSTPVIAFGGFFTVWHQISTIPFGSAKVATSAATNQRMANDSKILFQVGSKGSQVSLIQEQLTILGLFNHSITQYYGPVTAAAVSAFQSDQQLPPTGQVDGTTLSTLQTMVKAGSLNALTSSSTGVQNNGNSGSAGSAAPSQQTTPVTSSSAS